MSTLSMSPLPVRFPELRLESSSEPPDFPCQSGNFLHPPSSISDHYWTRHCPATVDFEDGAENLPGVPEGSSPCTGGRACGQMLRQDGLLVRMAWEQGATTMFHPHPHPYPQPCEEEICPLLSFLPSAEWVGRLGEKVEGG